jgi:uncharacterized protein (TIGR02147 family)
MVKRKHISLFNYLDYRLFLRDWYDQQKATERHFSFRAFSKRAGFTSPNIFKLVMDGERGLTEESLVKFCKGLKFNKGEQEFFRSLVYFNQAKSHDKKNLYYQKLLSSRKFSELKPIAKGQYKFYATWYHPVIREMITAKDFDGSPQWLAKRIRPSLSVKQVQKSIELLESLGFIQKTKHGTWQQASPLLTTGHESAEVTLLNYHQSLLALAHHLLPQVDQEDRDVSALTLGVASKKVPALKNMIQDFRKKVLEFVSDDHHAEEVVQLSMQLLPLTRKTTRSKK